MAFYRVAFYRVAFYRLAFYRVAFYRVAFYWVAFGAIAQRPRVRRGWGHVAIMRRGCRDRVRSSGC